MVVQEHRCPRSVSCGGQVLWTLLSYKVRLGGGILKMSHLCAA